MTNAESRGVFLKCALMILADQCPPDNHHYLCVEQEDDSCIDCQLCWTRFLFGLEGGRIDPHIITNLLRRTGAAEV